MTTEEESPNSEVGNSLVWYFAIGSMMHPGQCKGRNFVPLRSQPAKLLGFELGFFGKLGVAEAVEKSGACMHGVLHQVTQSQMKDLDVIEKGYIRKEGIAVPYHGSISEEEPKSVTATVYCRDDKKLKEWMSSKQNNSNVAAADSNEEKKVISTQRYIELLAAGAEHWAIDKDYIDMIRNRKFTPRKNPDDFRIVPPTPDSKTFDSIPVDTSETVHFSLNGKIVCFTYPPEHPMYRFHRERKASGTSPHMDINFANLLYDVKYGAPSTLDEFTKEHSAYIEDMIWDFMSATGSEKYFKVLGTYTKQTWIDG